MSDSSRSPTTVHWSIDFVEHLRTVHFALVTVSAALAILSIPYSPITSTAISQASQIEQLQNRWLELRRTLLAQAFESLHLPSDGQFTLLVKADTPALRDGAELFELDAPLDTFVKEDKLFPPAITRTAPRTVDEFRDWWNEISKAGLLIKVPDMRLQKNLGCDAFFWLVTEEEGGDILSDQPHDSACSLIGEDDLVPMSARDNRVHVQRIFLYDDAQPLAAELNVAVTRTELVTRGFPKFAVGKTFHPRVTLDVGTPLLVAVLHESAFQRVFPDWKVGIFSNAFAELAATPPYLWNIPINDARSRMDRLEPQEESFAEVLGVKIPTAALARWGGVLLVACQFYFWLHLHELTRKASAADPGWDVAWVGIYTSRIAEVTTVVSVAILPIVALCLLERVVVSAKPILPSVIWFPGTVLMIGVTLACLTAGRLRRLRTKRVAT